MRNIPDFTSPHGAAQLILESIPYTETAYILVRWVIPGELHLLLEECRRFCRMAGAERVLALSDTLGEEPVPSNCPIAFRVLSMQLDKASIPPADAALFPVTPALAEGYIRRYNEAMTGIDGAIRLTSQDKERLLQQGSCYFVHRDSVLLGLGQVDGNRVSAIAACVPGEGKAVLQALAEAIFEDTLCLHVADTNKKALRFYEKMGFVPTGIKELWLELPNQ